MQQDISLTPATDEEKADSVIGVLPLPEEMSHGLEDLSALVRAGTTLSASSNQARPMVVILFFFSAVGCTIGWTAVLSNLVYYSDALGMNSYLYLNLAVFTPLFPISLAQAKWDSYFDQRYQSTRSFTFRGVVGFFVSIGVLAFVPFASNNIVALSTLTALLGTASAALHGMLKQMASFIYPNCPRLPAAVTSGMQASAFFVLVVSLATGFGSSGDSGAIFTFYVSIAVLTSLCWICLHLLMSRCQDVFDSMSRRDSSFYSALSEPLQEDSEIDGSACSLEDENSLSVEMDYTSLWCISWTCCLSIMVTVGSSMSVASWFNRFESSDPSNQTLPQVLFYTRLFADLLGRPATLFLKQPSGKCLLIISLFRILFVPFFFIYASADEQLIPRNDALIIFGVAIFAFTSGYLVTSSYQLAPTLLSSQQQPSTSKLAGLMNVCFSSSLCCGLFLSFTLVRVGVT